MKTRSMRILTLSLTLAALLGLNSLAMAQGYMMGNGTMMGGNYGTMMGLSPEKQAAAQKLYTDFNSSTAPLRQQLTSKQYELNALVYGSTPDDKKVQALTKEVSDLRSKLYEARVNLQKQLVKEGLPVMGGMGMMNGGGMMGSMGCSVAGMGY